MANDQDHLGLGWICADVRQALHLRVKGRRADELPPTQIALGSASIQVSLSILYETKLLTHVYLGYDGQQSKLC